MELWRQILGLAVVFGLLGLLAWLARARVRPGARRARSFASFWRAAGGDVPVMQHVDRLRLTPQHSLHLVVIDGRRLVVGCSTGGLAVLSDLGTGEAALRCSTGVTAAGT